jgi:SAM-dependent methyltransferase
MGSSHGLDAIPGDYQYRAITEGPAVQRYWHRAKLRLVDAVTDISPTDVVLDAGCGSGVVADHVARRASEVVAIDGNPRAIAFASGQFRRPNLTFREGRLEQATLDPGRFSWILCLEVLEHLADQDVDALLAALREAAPPGGQILLTTPNYRGIWPVVEWLADRSGKVAHLAGDQHVNRFAAASLRRRLRQAGFAVQRAGTYCTFAPLAAVVGQRPADAAFDLELRMNLPFGNLLYAVATRR